MYIADEIAKGQLVPIYFGQAAATASQSGVALTVNGVASYITGLPTPWNYDIVGMSFDLSAAGTIGVFTIAPTVGGTAKTANQITVGTAASGSIRIPREKLRGLAGDVLGIKVTTDSSWDATTAKLGVVLWALVHLGGI